METVERHLALCVACRRETESLRRAQGLLAACRQTPIPPPRSDWNALRARLQLEGKPHTHEVEPLPLHLPRTSTGLTSIGFTSAGPTSVGLVERQMPRRHNRWLPSLAASTACAVALLLVAVGYRILHAPAPALKGGAPQPLAANAGKLSSTLKLAAADTTNREARPAAPKAANPYNNSAWINTPALIADTVRPVGASRRLSNPLRRAIPAFAHGRSELKLAANRRHGRRIQVADGQKQTPDSLHFRPYTPRPEDALPSGGGDEGRYALDSVVPVSNAGASDAYPMPSVRPVQNHSNAPY
jgi:hypothetical protein